MRVRQVIGALECIIKVRKEHGGREEYMSVLSPNSAMYFRDMDVECITAITNMYGVNVLH